MRHVKRGGLYLRALGPSDSWSGSPDDTEFSKKSGGRWNPPGEFGALYLSGNADVALENGLRIVNSMIGPAATVEDFAEDAETMFEIQEFVVEESRFVDAVTKEGCEELTLPDNYETGEAYELTRKIGRTAHASGENGIACVSAVRNDGEELAIFDTHSKEIARMRGSRRTFARWRADQATAAKARRR